ncbi:S1C family serine protease [Paenibacillus chartarius]|uniref:S1C family serine protease n=1 Tax=Paenibacillus chartarius TaxID=747481 RepID=A0ABV6DE92_9BACL
MSLFEDDFYSTKVSRKVVVERGSRRFRGSRRSAEGFARGWSSGWLELAGRPVTLAVSSAVAGALVVMFLFLVFGGGSSSGGLASGGAGTAGGGSAGGSASGIPGDVHQTAGDLVVRAAEKVRPTIVSVVSTRKDENAAVELNGVGIGSGVIFQRSGDKVRVLTNNHVVDGASSFELVLATGEKRKGTLIGKDYITDLAVLEMDGAGIKAVAEFGDSEALRLGEAVIALGNPLGLGSSPTVTWGIVSSPRRTIPVSLSGDGEYDWQMDVIQTDAAINEGNSGGALVNMEGKVIGINTMKIADIGVEGLGFAIPIKDVQPIVDSLIKYHKVKRPQLGVRLVDLASFKGGVESLKLPEDVKTGVIVLEASGPAAAAGLKSQDVIVELDGKPVGSAFELRKYLYTSKGIGDKITISYYRGGKKSTATAVLIETPDPEK